MVKTKDAVIVYGVDTQIGLSIVRELGKRGCYVVAIGKSKQSLGLRSKYVAKGFVLEKGSDADKVAHLHAISGQTGATKLLCVSEDDILFFNRVKHQLAPIEALVPSQENIDKVLSKEYTAQVAAEVGIATPKSITINSPDGIQGHLGVLTYPVILKWSNPHDVMKKAGKMGLSIEKIIYCDNQQELLNKIDYYAPLEEFPMIQAYCPGHGLGQFFFMHDGEPLLSFQHRRIHEWPPEGGVSSLCESVPLSHYQALQQQSIALLRAMNWQGVAMVEYRYDDKTNNAVLMEINGRFWGSFPLAYHAKIPFAWFTYKVLGCKEVPIDRTTTYPQIYCRNTLVEFKRLIRVIFQRQKIKDKTLSFSVFNELWCFFSGFINPKMRYYLFELGDLKPLIADWKILINKALKRQ